MDDLKLFDDLEGVDPLGPESLARGSSVSPRSPKPGSVQTAVVAAVAVGAGLAAVAAGCSPTGSRFADAVASFAFGAGLTLATAKARRWSWLTLSGLAALGAQGAEPLVAAMLAVAGSLVAMALPRSRTRWLGAIVGGLSAQILLRLPDYGFSGSSAIWAAVAVAPVLVSGYARCRSRTRWILRLGFGCVAATWVIATIAFAAAAMTARATMRAGADQARAGFDAARAARQDDAVAALR